MTVTRLSAGLGLADYECHPDLHGLGSQALSGRSVMKGVLAALWRPRTARHTTPRNFTTALALRRSRHPLSVEERWSPASRSTTSAPDRPTAGCASAVVRNGPPALPVLPARPAWRTRAEPAEVMRTSGYRWPAYRPFCDDNVLFLVALSA